MMTLEQLIYKKFIEYHAITKYLAQYNDRPAIFYQLAPEDTQNGWNNTTQYPRIVYTLDMQSNQERKSVGIMMISLYCDDTGTQPEEIEPLIRKCLKDLFIQPEKSSPYCFAWSRTDNFDIPETQTTANTKVIGTDIRFDILEYPTQETSDPDPIVAINRYIKSIIPEAMVIGLDNIEEFLEADAKAPVFYCRLETVETSAETNTIAWMDCKIAVHVICPKSEQRIKIVMSLANQLSLDGEIIMLDNSPMTVKRLQVNNQADYLEQGQLYIFAHYGLLRYQSQPHKIQHIKIDFKEGIRK